MALELVQQFEKVLGDAKKVLIILPESPSGDAISSGYALHRVLQEKSIDTSLAFSDSDKEAEKYEFLPKPKEILPIISGIRDFVLSFNTKTNKITSVRKEFVDDELRIYITPEKGSIDPRDFSFIPAKFKYDLLIVIDSPDKESTGKIYEENPDIFYEVPVVNIDHHNDNDNFGQINFVNLTASSTAEVLAGIFQKDPAYFKIDENIANCLLAGIISATDSFQKKNTTPKSLEMAAQLMDLGADQQLIVRWLYKTQPFNILKLWGRVMARLNWDEEMKLAWSLVSLEDFVQSRSKPEDVPRILEKIKDNYSAGNIFLVLYNEKPDVVVGMIKNTNSNSMEKFAEMFQGKIKKDLIIFRLENKNILEAEKEVLEKIKAAKI